MKLLLFKDTGASNNIQYSLEAAIYLLSHLPHRNLQNSGSQRIMALSMFY